MAWFEFHQSLLTHRKTYILADILHVSRPTAVGHLAFLWAWALDNAPDGNLTDVTPGVIKLAVDWPKKAEQFVDACVVAGFMDSDDVALTIHDWDDYAGRLMAQRERNRINTQAHRKRARDGDRPVTSPSTVPDSTGQDSTQPVVPAAAAAPRRDYIAVENLTGLLNKSVADAIDEFRGEHPNVTEEWVEAACVEAAESNVRNWKYVRSILNRWSTEGFKADKRKPDDEAAAVEAHDAELAAVMKRAGA